MARMSKRLRFVIFVGLALVVIAGITRLVLTGQQPVSAQASSTVQDTAHVERGDVSILVSATGSIQANQTVALAFTATGKVKTILVTEGDYVRKRQTLATLDDTSANDALLLAQAAVETQQIALRTLTDKPRQVDIDVYQAQLDLAKAQLTESSSGTSSTTAQLNALKVESAKNSLWQTELTRDANNEKKAELLDNGSSMAWNQAQSLPTDQQNNANITASDYDVQIAQANLAASTSSGGSVSSIASAQASVLSAQVALDSLLSGGDKDEVTKAQAQLQSAQHALDAAKVDVSRTVLVAPFDGVISAMNLHVGEAVPTSNAIEMLDTGGFYVDVSVDETDIGQVAVGQPVTLTMDALSGVKLNGQVAAIATTSTTSGNVVTYTVRISIDPAGQPIRSAMSTTANIIVQQAKDALRVANRFIATDRTTGKSTASVRQADGTFKTVEVTVGVRNSTYSEIKSGLSEGDVLGPATTTLVTGGTGSTSNSGSGMGIPGLGGPGGGMGGGPGGPPPG